MKNLNLKNGITICLTSTLILMTGCQSSNSQEQVNEQNKIEISNDIEQEELEFDNFKSEQEEIETYMFEEDFELAKEKGKEYFINGIDFVFYGTSYKGITFDELASEAQKETLRNLNIMDSYVMEVYPDYKEDISDKYTIAAEFINEKYHLVLDKIRLYIGDENYNSVKEIKDQIKEDVIATGGKAKTKINDWYNDFKQK